MKGVEKPLEVVGLGRLLEKVRVERLQVEGVQVRIEAKRVVKLWEKVGMGRLQMKGEGWDTVHKWLCN